MRHLLNNLSNVPIEICKISLKTDTLFEKSKIFFDMTLHGCLQGHADIGSFVICKRYDDYSYRSWGNLKITQKTDENGVIIFEISEQNQSE